MDTKTRTIIKCKCGKKFINATDIPDLFEKGQIRGYIKHLTETATEVAHFCKWVMNVA